MAVSEATSEPLDSEESDAKIKGRVPGLWMASGLALILAPISPLLAYVGALWSVLLLLLGLYFAKKGYRTRATLGIAAFSFAVSISVGVLWERFIVVEAEVDGKEAQRQRVLEDEFDRAFSDAKENGPNAEN